MSIGPRRLASFYVKVDDTAQQGGRISSGIMQKGLSLHRGLWLGVAVAAFFNLALEVRNMLNHEPRFTVGPGRSPIQSFRFVLKETQFGQFERQMQKIGAEFGFENKTRPSTSRPYDVFFVLERSEIDLLGTNDMEEKQIGLRFSIDFLPKRDRPSPPPENVNVLVEGLKQFLAPVEGAVLTEIAVQK